MVNPGGTGTPSFIISASNAPLLYWMREEERERESIGQHTSRVCFFFAVVVFIDRSIGRSRGGGGGGKRGGGKRGGFFGLIFFFHFFFLLLKMMMTSKNVSTGEFVSELKYVSTFLTDKRAKDALVPENIFQLRAPIAGCRVENVHDFRFPVRF